MENKELILINKQLDQLTGFQSSGNRKIGRPEGESWIGATAGLFERIYGPKSVKIEEIKALKDHRYASFDSPSYFDTVEFIAAGRQILEPVIAEIEHLGIPSLKDSGSGVNLTVNQNQSNIQKVNINLIIEILGDELSGRHVTPMISVFTPNPSGKQP